MLKNTLTLFLLLSLSACITVPVNDNSEQTTCLLSSDKKTLKIVDVAKETNSYYSVAGLVLSPILVPTSAIISGSYVVVNNIYNFGEKKVKCD